MKYFKCGQCQAPYKIDETKLTTTRALIKCVKCGASNIIKLGPVLVVQTKEKTQTFPLQIGVNTIGRTTETTQSSIGLEDKFVSRNHAEILIESKDNKLFVTIKDVGSTNGTLNSRKEKLQPQKSYSFLTTDYFIIGLSKLTLKFN